MEPVFDYPVRFFTLLTSENETITHSHANFEFFLVRNGSITHIKDKSEKERLSLGACYLIAPSHTHSFTHGESCEHRDVIISPEFMKESCDYVDAALYDFLLQNGFTYFHCSLEEIVFVENMITNFYNIDDVAQKKNYEKLILISMLGLVYKQNAVCSKNSNDFRWQCEQVCNNVYVNKNASELVQEYFNYNPVYFRKKFQNTFGTTLSEHINNLRLSYSAYLLTSTNYSLTEICRAIGVESESYFIKIFKNKYHKTPLQYRKSKE